jgi:hypothetical protein
MAAKPRFDQTATVFPFLHHPSRPNAPTPVANAVTDGHDQAAAATIAMLRSLVGLSGKGHKGTFRDTVLYNPSTINARDFVAFIRMAVISFVF